ncbi:hypothetical protein ACHAWX_004650 [Stephanocyclus meneghinianus]
MSSSAAIPTSRRPGPPNEQASSKILHPIYQAIDAHNYSKALKLTVPPSSNAAAEHFQWDIVRALRVHALERSGKRRESLILLWDMLANGVHVESAVQDATKTWHELRRRIETLTDASDLVDSDAHASHALQIQLFDAVQRLDMAAFDADVPAFITDAAVAACKDSNHAMENKYKSNAAGKGSKSKSKASATHKAKTAPTARQPQSLLPPITDETVLQTLAVTLRIEGLFDTMSEMYHQAVVEASKTTGSDLTLEQRHEFGTILEEAVCVHFKAVSDCTALKRGDGGDVKYNLQDLQAQSNLAKYYERMQTSCLQLAKHSGEPLHFQWTAMASLWYKQSLEDLVRVMEYFHRCLNKNDSKLTDKERGRIERWILWILGMQNINEIPDRCQMLKQKMGLLPRLAESLSFRMIQNRNTGKDEDTGDTQRNQYAPSETDWDVYLEALLMQNKLEDALEVLRGINCPPLIMGSGDKDGDVDDNSNNCIPQIHDEDTIKNHTGTILPYTQRKKLEQMSKIALKLGKFEEAEGWFKELLTSFPDQWTYWLGLIDSCVLAGLPSDRAIDEEGWKRCQSFADDIITSKDASQKHPTLRGPHLFLIELAALKVRHLGPDVTELKGRLLMQLRKAICDYGDKFGTLASCCFADLRVYLELFVQQCSHTEGEREIAGDVFLMMKWAKGLWMIHTQSSSSKCTEEGDTVSDQLRERRKKLRMYIFAIQVCYCLAAAVEKLNQPDVSSGNTLTSTMDLLQNYTPSLNEMIVEWKTSLTFLPGVPPKDGGQKETLPGDEIVLLISQYLHLKTSYESKETSSPQHLLAAAGLLEEAIEHSPYNPSLKIAAIGVYSRLKSAHRAFKHYEDMGVKYIQLDSCSYLILPLLVRGGLYNQAITISAAILRFHGSTSKDVKDYSTKSFRKGYLLKANEIVAFQREKMRSSVQLCQAKSLVMDCAALLNTSDSSGSKHTCEVRLGAEKGLCGCEEDTMRAEQLVRDSESHFNAPSILHAASNARAVQDFCSSDNRDMTVNYFEILYRHQHSLEREMITESLMRGHTQGLLVRAVMATELAKAPKKGKIPKCTDGMLSRCQSLLTAVQKANQFIDNSGIRMNEVDRSLWAVSCLLCEVITTVIQGSGDGDASDSLAEREKSAVSSVILAGTHVSKARCASVMYFDAADGEAVCKLLPDRIIPLFTIIETTARLFALFGWGKRKTKEAAGALANLALILGDFLTDLLEIMKRFRSSDCFESLVEDMPFDIGYFKNATQHVVSSRGITADLVDPFLLQMKEALMSFAVEES